MMSLALGYLHIADHLATGASSLPPEVSPESRQRTAINRYYYAARCMGDYYLADYLSDPIYCGMSRKYHDSITKRLTSLGGAGRRDHQKIVGKLGGLYSKREDADYNGTYTSWASDVALVMKEAWEIKAIFDRLITQ